MKNLILVAVLSMSAINFVKAQDSMEVYYSILKDGKETEHVGEVKSSDMGMLFINLLHIPDYSGYDLITAVVRFKGRENAGGYVEYTYDEFNSSLKTSKKSPGMKYLLLAIVNKIDNPSNGNGSFTIDQYPFESFGFDYLFSKEGAGNLDSFQLEFELRGQKIVEYETVWENNKSITKPVYGEFTSLGPKAEVTVYTDDNVSAKPKSNKVGDPNDLKNLFGK